MIRRVVDRAGRARARRRGGRDAAISAPGRLRGHIPPRVMRHASVLRRFPSFYQKWNKYLIFVVVNVKTLIISKK